MPEKETRSQLGSCCGEEDKVHGAELHSQIGELLLVVNFTVGVSGRQTSCSCGDSRSFGEGFREADCQFMWREFNFFYLMGRWCTGGNFSRWKKKQINATASGIIIDP